jgi:hypothetical protein
MYAHELTGAPKIPESFSSFLSSATVLRRKFGSVHIRFPPLLSVRAIMSNSEEEVGTMEPRAAESGGAGTVMQGLLGPRGVVAQATAAAVVNALVHNTVITSTGLAAAVEVPVIIFWRCQFLARAFCSSGATLQRLAQKLPTAGGMAWKLLITPCSSFVLI